MARVLLRCPHCGKIAKLLSENEAFGQIWQSFECGHTVVSKKIEIPSGRDEFWHKLRAYQQTGVQFLENSNFRALLADDMGLGKTIQVLMCVRYHFEDLTPTLYLVKSGLKYQWATEYQNWVVPDLGKDLTKLPYIISGSDMPVLPGFKTYICSFDTFPKLWEQFVNIGIKLIVLDESHNLKNGEAKRTIALKRFVNTCHIPHVICTSGTPITNRTPEFFTTLNLLHPTEWYSMRKLTNMCETDEKGRYIRLSRWSVDHFRTMTEKYIIRREKREVLKDLPPFSRNFRWAEVEDQELKDLYNNELDLMSNWLNNQRKNGNKIDSMSMLGWLAKLRRITGLSKVKDCVEDALAFLEYADEECGDKIAIGYEHKAVGHSLKAAFEREGYKVVLISGEDSPEAKLEKVELFKHPDYHIGLLSTRACGEGLNLQFCSVTNLLERQWNAAKEVQFEGRFDRFGQTRPVSCDYFIAKGTLDEWLTTLVEDKRQNCAHDLGDELNLESNGPVLMELMEKSIANRL